MFTGFMVILKFKNIFSGFEGILKKKHNSIDFQFFRLFFELFLNILLIFTN